MSGSIRMLTSKITTVGFLFVLFFSLFTFEAKSQSFELPKSADLLKVTMIPSVPKEYDHITVDLQSYLTDLNKAIISWSLNGVEIKKGRGEKHFEFDAGGSGSATRLQISIQTIEGETVSRDITVRPQNIDLLWEASTYIPPLYKGKALFTPQADLKIVAMPNVIDETGARIGSKNLIYRWKINGKFLESASGFGKDILFVSGPSVLRTTSIEVEASSLSGTIKAKGSIALEETSPEIVFYENHPLLGISYERALGEEVALENKEITIVSIPYFFSTEERNFGLSYAWSLNGNPIGEKKKSSLTLRKETEAEGEARLEAEIKSETKKFQFTRDSLSIQF